MLAHVSVDNRCPYYVFDIRIGLTNITMISILYIYIYIYIGFIYIHIYIDI